MSSYDVVLSKAFQRQLKKLIKKNPNLRQKVAKVLKLFAQEIANSSLKLHKLEGHNNWTVSVTGDIDKRILRRL
ncbi:MAG: plasmid stabilization protein [Candidatus Curtissbacteria bacterium GW2011_GWA1_40_16]|uniref:Plasmid stabilization protein n=1 Tax=Candidatus Curtissbacteria bacterium GW2011_GWA1_40_16 TaxID=1618405 RepID=A0A0G0RJ62_9BACT|nr:MAG: plasmid stabilization protein [Candidatus Curtissbacteria bacterium GW2011_GWA1_40_16]